MTVSIFVHWWCYSVVSCLIDLILWGAMRWSSYHLRATSMSLENLTLMCVCVCMWASVCRSSVPPCFRIHFPVLMMALVFILQTNADFCSPWSLFWSGLKNYLVCLALSRAQQCFEKIDRVIHSGSTYILMSVHSRIFISFSADSRDLFLSLLHFFFFSTVPGSSHKHHIWVFYFCSVMMRNVI